MERKTYSMRVTEDLMKALRHLAIDRGIPFSRLMDEAFEDLLKKYAPKEKAKKSPKR
jgi:predicted DNA binding CopG/RHH family protein